MKILVIGRGGREHAIIQKLAESPQAETIYAAPGNAGIADIATCVAIDEMDFDALIDFSKTKGIDLTIVGPEAPLSVGIVDKFEKAGLRIFGPSEAAAAIEGSKSFAKDFMIKHKVPTAAYEVFSDVDQAKTYIQKQGAPIVIKADGLAAGKGVVVAETVEEAEQAVDDMLVSKAFAEAGAKVVIEEFLAGREFSLMALVNGHHVYPLTTARDHKRAFDGDAGPNTGGMGAYAPVDDVTSEAYDFAVKEIVQKTADGMVEEGKSFTGVLYAGLIMTENGPKVIEFNARFGDPETQVILPLMDNDFAQVVVDVLNEKDPGIKWKDGYCLGVVTASAGYPGSYEKGMNIPELSKSADTYIVHAGTKKEDGQFVSDGGRVLLAGAYGSTFAEARDKAYEAIAPFEGNRDFYYRTDIGK